MTSKKRVKKNKDVNAKLPSDAAVDAAYAAITREFFIATDDARLGDAKIYALSLGLAAAYDIDFPEGNG